MGPFVLFRASHSREFYVHNIYLSALLVSVCLADLPCSDCFLVSNHRTLATGMEPAFNRQLGRKVYHESIPEIGGRLATGNYRPGAVATKFGLPTHPRREMSITRRATGGQRVYANSNSTSAPPDVEVEALAAFKAAITSDPSNALRSWITGAAAVNDSDTCNDWVGVTCSPQFPNHVVALNLSNLELEGILDAALPALRQIPFLQSLDLSSNIFSGSIQGEPLTNFSHLSYFNLSNNFVTGLIPSEMGELLTLQNLDLGTNNLTGPIPESLGNCSLLVFLNIENNAIKGEIPPSLGKLSNLIYLVLDNNALSGSIPGELGNCSSLTVLGVWDNFELGQELPHELSRLPLKKLLLEACSFSGTFPPWIVNLTSLTDLWLDGNQFVGEIPDTIGQLGNLTYFMVNSNDWTGAVPPSITNCTSLISLGVDTCFFTGHIPNEIGLLSSLQYLNMISNNLTGVIPSSLSNCSALSSLQLGLNLLMDPEPIPPWIESLTDLTFLWLSGMNLEGEIPESLGKLSNLQYLEMAGNDLTGKIPVVLQNCTYLTRIDMPENQLTGDIPSELGRLRFMSFFDARSNYFTGPFPEFIANWSQLYAFDVDTNFLSGPLDDRLNIDHLGNLMYFLLDYNGFEGPIPETLGNCSSIIWLGLTFNRFSGVIPGLLGNMTGLQNLALAGNQFQGEIPVDLFKLGLGLGILDLGYNELVGSIPLEIGRLFHLSELLLHNNNFSGYLPSSLGNCSGMNYLDFSYNKFEGSIPGTAISKMSSSLQYLDLSHNLFSGSWPRELSELNVIQTINLSSNNISGLIPAGLGKCVDLIQLDISINDLTGGIPQDLGSLTHLDFFNASFNDFFGPVPQSGFFNSNLINGSSFLGNRGLCGPTTIIGLHHQHCQIIPKNASIHQDCKGFNCNQVRIPVIAVSISILVGVVLVIVGLKSGLILSRGWRDDNHFMLNFGNHIRISEGDVLQTIHDPSSENLIGIGAKSIVYKGVLPGGEMFALKKLLPNNDVQDHNIDSKFKDPMEGLNSLKSSELVKEAEILAKLRHKNILKCLSFYSSLDHKALILEYMCGGSLHKHLHEMEPCELTWQRRLKVAMGVAQGMTYLHHDFPEPLIHRDLKPSNILLDANFEPKVGDFGISKFVNPERDGEVTASTFCGTVGYMPPEYASQPWVSTKGDVFSYGMVLIELLTRRPPSSTNTLDDTPNLDLRNWVLDGFHERPLELLDTSLVTECNQNDIATKQMMLLLRVSLFCTKRDPQNRPSMINVVGMLTHIINLGVEPVPTKTMEELANELDPTVWPREDPSIEGSEFGLSKSV